MLFKEASAIDTAPDYCWVVKSDLHQIILPRLPAGDRQNTPIKIGLLGTRERKKSCNYQWAKTKTQKMAALLGSVGSISLIDTRRDGVGGQGSWSPKQFGTIIPELIKTHYDNPGNYEYLHLPGVAPTIELRQQHFPWQKFRNSYTNSLTPNNLDVLTAFVESASTMQDCLPILMCSEEWEPDFHKFKQDKQNDCYCHRFTLAEQIGLRLRKEYQKVIVYSLDLVDFMTQWKSSKQPVFANYQPDCWRQF